MNYHLYNNFHNGDIFFSRPIIKMLQTSFPTDNFFFHHKCTKGILKDLDNILELDLNEYCNMQEKIKIYNNSDVYINTWYGQNNLEFFNRGGGTTLTTVYLILNYIKQNLNLNFNVEESVEIYPSINYKKLNLNLSPIENDYRFKILICNDDSKSGQSHNTELDYMIGILTQNYNDATFYVTKKINLKKNNLIFTDDLFPNRPNLLEISNLSRFCNFIIGRSSGPYSYSMCKENILDPSKSFLSLTNIPITGIWDNRFHKCNYSYNSSSNIKIITSFINEKLYPQYANYKKNN